MNLKTAELTLTLKQLTEMPVRSIRTLECARPAAALVQRVSEDSWVFSVCVNTKPLDIPIILDQLLTPAGAVEGLMQRLNQEEEAP